MIFPDFSPPFNEVDCLGQHFTAQNVVGAKLSFVEATQNPPTVKCKTETIKRSERTGQGDLVAVAAYPNLQSLEQQELLS